MKDILKELEHCKLCKRNCGVNRKNNELGFCRASYTLEIGLVSLHMWEEPCISGTNGSGTIFFSNCNLNCVFCQNHLISQEGTGKEVSIERLAEIFLEQQSNGAHNINLVTPTHYIPQIISAIKLAKKSGLSIPILFNTNSYLNISALKMLDGYIDVYLPDVKYFNDKTAIKYSNAPGYFTQATKAIEEMFRQVGNPIFDDNGIIQKGVIARHLLLPGQLFESKKIVDYLYSKYNDSIYISLMNQYTPLYKSKDYAEINKTIKPELYDSLIDYCLKIGIKNGFIQEEGTSKDMYVPDFNLNGV